MAEIFQKYRMILIIFIVIIVTGLVFLMISRQNLNKIPSRGVFVLQIITQDADLAECKV